MATDFNREYQKLNSAQKKAVDAIDGPVIVIAGPGSGKTQLLGMRVANILKRTDTDPNNILCLTFTEAAANNLRSRLTNLIGSNSSRVEIYTFHGFGTHVIQNYPEYFYDKPLLTPINELGEFELLQTILSRLHHDDPLSKKVGDSFLHQKTIMDAISWFKQAGLRSDDLRTDAQKSTAFFNHINKHLSVAFKESPSSKLLESYTKLYHQIRETGEKYASKIADESAQELANAIEQIDPESRYAKFITEWRDKWLVRTNPGHWQYADQHRNIILSDLCDVYEKYEKALADRGLYTYDDMILRTYDAIKENEELKFILQERYQYILVDEYQDTNGAQDKLLSLLADNPVNEGRPNLMVVGDDDQAIYRFQGSESSIMFDFIARYKDPKLVVLNESYRSGQELLNLAKQIISSANDRLEAIDSRISKDLISSGQVKNTKIDLLVTESESDYYLHITDLIKDLINNGENPSSIAVIAPKHRYLKALVPYLLAESVAINYERRDQILEQPRIVEILDLVELVRAIRNTQTQKIETLLPKILAAPYFSLSTNDWWDLALFSQYNKKSWLQTIQSSENIALRNFAQSIKKIALESYNQSFELTLAYSTGSKSIELTDGKFFDLPWRNYYFSEANILKKPDEFIRFINQFNTLKRAFEEWSINNTGPNTIENFCNFIELFRSSKLSLLDESPYTASLNSVNLMTAYKAKGLEWDNVIILNCQNDVWGPKTRNQNHTFKLPSGLKWIEPARDNSNDLVRLFYVALTRAEKRLFLTDFEINNNSKPTEKLEWLDNDSSLPKRIKLKAIAPISIALSKANEWQNQFMTPTSDLAALLQPALNNYKLSATHLNEFLSIHKGGPKNFFFKYILKVPDLLNTNAMYGSSIHKTLEYVHKEFNQSGDMPKIEEILGYFNSKIVLNPLTSSELRYFKKRGKDNLKTWFKAKQTNFSNSDISEHSFSSENISLGKARLTGKIDVLKQIDSKSLTVIDYKTSTPLFSWQGNSGLKAINSDVYQRQLMFYKLLVENSNSYGKKFKVSQGLIQFITPDENGEVIDLKYDYVEEDLNKLTKLIDIVWQKILNLDFPNTDTYPDTLSGVRSFESDLLNNKL